MYYADYVKDKGTFNQLPAGTGTIIKGNTIVHLFVGVIPGQRTEIQKVLDKLSTLPTSFNKLEIELNWKIWKKKKPFVVMCMEVLASM